MDVGDIVKFNKNGEEIVGIVYENGNKQFGNFQVQTVGVKKHRYLSEAMLAPATPEELTEFTKSFLEGWGPEQVIAQETEEAGGVLPPQITEAPVDPLGDMNVSTDPDKAGLN